MPNLTDRPYAEWLEEVLRFIAEEDPSKIVVACRCKDGDAVATKYYSCTVEDQAVFAHYLQTDALMGTVMANADAIAQQARELEAEEDEEAES